MDLWNKLETSDGSKQRAFWNSLDFSNKKYLVSRFSQDQLLALFNLMDTPGKMDLLNMVNLENEQFLTGGISEELQREMFFHAYFGLKEQSDEDRAGFVSKLVDDHTAAQS